MSRAIVDRARSSAPSDTLLLLPMADALEIRYLDPTFAEWVDTWEDDDRLRPSIGERVGP